jgi:hypothetical protein
MGGKYRVSSRPGWVRRQYGTSSSETLDEQRWEPERAVRRFDEANRIMIGT